jgi:hypothetical protein
LTGDRLKRSLGVLGLSFAAALATGTGPAHGQPADLPEASLAMAIEVRPTPRPAAVIEHAAGASWRLEHALSFGLGSFPDVEVRTSLRNLLLGPVVPWLALRTRRIHLRGLPPVENYAGLGLGFSSDPSRRLSLAGGFGARFQIPPLTPEAAGDRGTYLAENVAAELFFAVRVRVW